MIDVSLTGMQTLMATLGIIALTVAIILFLRKIISGRSAQDLTEKYRDADWKSPLKSRTKYPDVDGLKFTGPLFRYGLASALALTLFAFSWTTYDLSLIHI